MRIAVFRSGTHTDASGNTRRWTDADLDAIANKYNPAQHEAPVVIGHPKENGPAFGWVKGLQREGETLFANIKPTVDAFTGWVNKGLYKKRSISLYPDMTLRHIGFLGAQPPAVKGLPDFAFEEDPEAAVFEFEESLDFMVEKREDGYYVLSESKDEDGKHKVLGGPFATKEEAEKRLGQVEYFKTHDHAEGKAYPNEHAARMVEPDKFEPESFRRKEIAPGVSLILGKKKGGDGSMVTQAVRFDKNKFTPEEARKWLKKNDMHPMAFNKATTPADHSEKGGRMNFWEQLKEKLAAAGVSFREMFGSDTPPVLYTEDQVAGLKAKAAQEAQDAAAASFAEKEAALKAREQKLVVMVADAGKKQIAEFTEDLKRKGILVPAMEKMGMGITSFMQAVAELETTYEFAEDSAKKQTPLEFMQEFLSKLPPAISFASASKDDEDDGEGTDAEKIDDMAKQHMKNNPGTKYRDAVIAVSKKMRKKGGK